MIKLEPTQKMEETSGEEGMGIESVRMLPSQSGDISAVHTDEAHCEAVQAQSSATDPVSHLQVYKE